MILCDNSSIITYVKIGYLGCCTVYSNSLELIGQLTKTNTSEIVVPNYFLCLFFYVFLIYLSNILHHFNIITLRDVFFTL